MEDLLSKACHCCKIRIPLMLIKSSASPPPSLLLATPLHDLTPVLNGNLELPPSMNFQKSQTPL